MSQLISLDKVLEVIEEMRTNKWDECIVEFDHTQNTCSDCDKEMGFNFALTDLSNTLKELKI